METQAIVSHEPKDGQVVWRMEKVELNQTKDDELLVEIVATGICHTDIFFSSLDKGRIGIYPRVLGHEGIGWVRSVGSKVTAARVGDAVSLSFGSCKKCTSCANNHPAYCNNFVPVNYGAGPAYKQQDGSSLAGYFFGQSSFSNLSNVPESSIVNISSLVTDEGDMAILAALGCSFQSGASTVTKLVGAGPKDSVVVIGLGAVGLAAVMAAKIQGCKQIIGVDRVASRLDLAADLGATHTVDTTSPGVDLVAEIKRITEQTGGPSITIDASGALPLIKSAVEFTANCGKIVILGVPPVTASLDLNIVSFMQSGKFIVGSIEGDAIPSEFIPQMIQWYRDGKFPLDRLVKTYRAGDFQQALADSKAGSTIKPVLLWK